METRLKNLSTPGRVIPQSSTLSTRKGVFTTYGKKIPEISVGYFGLCNWEISIEKWS